MRSLLLVLIALARSTAAPAGILHAASETAQQETPRPALKEYNVGEAGLALSGYDPVAYSPEGGSKPAKGNAALTASVRGVTYRFASQANEDRFLADPARYEPAYGGWCAYAMAQAEKVEIDPESFRIRGGRLFLFYKSFFNDTRKKWLSDEAHLSVRADAGWMKVAGERYARNAVLFALGDDDLALAGRDPVSYFLPGASAPLRGEPEHSLRYEGVLYRFASEENRALFQADPQRYEPAFGGWSALALAGGRLVAPEPDDFLVLDGRLYLFHREKGTDVRPRWSADAANLSQRAAERWARVLEGKD